MLIQNLTAPQNNILQNSPEQWILKKSEQNWLYEMVPQDISKEETMECYSHFAQVTTWCRYSYSGPTLDNLVIPSYHQQTLEHPWLSLGILIITSHP